MIEIIYILAVLGAANAITREFVFEWLRKWADRHAPVWLQVLLDCPTCLSFWLSLATVWLMPFSLVECIALPFAVSFVAKVIYSKIDIDL